MPHKSTATATRPLIAVLLDRWDLKLMKAGEMDPASRTQTIIGIVLGCIWIVGKLGLLVAIVWVWMNL